MTIFGLGQKIDLKEVHPSIQSLFRVHEVQLETFSKNGETAESCCPSSTKLLCVMASQEQQC